LSAAVASFAGDAGRETRMAIWNAELVGFEQGTQATASLTVEDLGNGRATGLTTTVRDTVSGTVKTYKNPDLTAAPPVQDTAAIACSTRTDVADEEAVGGDGGGEHQAVAPLRRVETPEVIAGDHAERAAIPRAASGCVSNATTLCISDQPGDQRFKVQVHYATSQDGGLSGSGNAISLVSLGLDHGGIFWFFDADNPEMLIKVLNACSVNQKFWVYYSAGTNVGLTVTVTDTETGQSKVYKNADLTPAPPVQDVNALPCQ
jgi:hypothetical protein